jgi:DNA-binding MarR family transcriptional regulator
MKILSNEQIIWNFLHKCRNGISVNELARQTEVSKPTAVKITDKFKKSGDLTKPEFVRGKKKSLLILTKFTLRDNFQTVKKTRNEIEKRLEKPIIIITKKEIRLRDKSSIMKKI